MITALDTNRDVRPFAPWLKSQGFRTVLRYYTALASPKALTRAEALALVAQGFTLGAVYQDRGTKADDFSVDRGKAAGLHALDYAMSTIGQPRTSGLYFSVDFDASQTEINKHILPHFRGIRDGLTEPGETSPSYRIGAYGSGLVLRNLLDAGLIDLCWLSMSSGFRESKAFFKSGRWNLHQKLEVKDVPTPGGRFSYDPNEVADSGCGDFTLELPASLTAGDAAGRFRVIARSGLLLRKGPGTEFNRLASMPSGTELQVLERSGDWALVDLQGDGLADGYCHAGFLQELSWLGSIA